ncbi:hypothetical protein C8A03DRAFT_14436 [Achaetomium macrosporum]|uniref:Zn(2)-C6 fungal-type domain-containing protein n=1 Tax=Achaetomium macrosporum TaxID=79813 RepID=A0AAN7CBU0_9PEZI|nr:hypothetical protein C8A03DRAFT_14436 [Achaetomium macrosporum]
MDSIEVRAKSTPGPRAPRIGNACEACRAAKVKCQGSTQLGICKRCLDSKRECIFKTGPRTRRPRQKRLNDPTTAASTTETTTSSTSTSSSAPPPRSYPPPPGPSKTFTIDIPMPADDDIADSLEALRLAHDKAIDMLVPHDGDVSEDEYAYEYDNEKVDGEMEHDWFDQDQDQASSTGAAGSVFSHASSLSTPPTSSTGAAARQSHDQDGGQPDSAEASKPTSSSKSRTIASLRLQPQFNLDSAEKLLETFREVMLSHFHCVVVSESDTVASMAKERPFVLLAVLAAASGSRTLQGHSLYDEEFRKILGLKFVAGGERTLELLQGLVVYITWYPFHLRPKNKQALQYTRMVVDIVTDLELDEDPGCDSLEVPPTPERLDQIRLYLASYYLASAFASTWGRTPSLTYTEYTARCCDLLQHHSPLRGDHVLAWQVRIERLIEETNDLRRTQRGRSQSEYQISLMIRGMETQLAEWEARMGPEMALSTPSLRIAVLFTRVFLSGAPLLKLPSPKLAGQQPESFRPDPHRLVAVIPAIHEIYEYFLTLKPADVNSFIGIEWGALILSVILGFRMSFPLALCQDWDDRAARELIKFGEYMDRLCQMGGEGYDVEEIKASLTPSAPPSSGAGAGLGRGRRTMDVLSASKIVLDMVRKKFLKRVAKLQQRRQQAMEATLVAAAAAPPHPVPPHDPAVGECPMMDGSLEPYYPYWNETFTSNLVAGGISAIEAHGAGQAEMDIAGVGVPNDLWTAMTTGWAQGDTNFEGL